MDQKDRFNRVIAGKELKNYIELYKNELSYNHGNSKYAKFGIIYVQRKYKKALVPKVYHSFSMTNGDPRFIENLSLGHKLDKELSKLITSGARQDGLLNINKKSFYAIKLFIPSEQEQVKISNIMDVINHIITLYERKKELLKKFQQGFSDILFKKNPKECVSLGDYFYFNKGKNIGNKDLINNGKYYAIVYGELYTTYNYVISKVFSKTSIKGFKGRKNDLLFPSSSTVPFGTATCSALEIDNIELGNDIIVARPKNTNELDSAFISYQINSKRKILYPIISGTTITHMYSKDLSKIRIWLPNITTQNYISNILQRISHLNILVDKKVNILKEIKKEFLNTMFI